ncbi:hypothetical protein OPV22_004514 [Ensete ventricosum]|uniref:Uncharacterized protein n=1 Tax=Ensete ventricosum TaxID=4639 RepID=A0AAV8S3N3_ENSVE|nr:hypothetical protein OPV22_004514 [Ensete ventricosum]
MLSATHDHASFGFRSGSSGFSRWDVPPPGISISMAFASATTSAMNHAQLTGYYYGFCFLLFSFCVCTKSHADIDIVGRVFKSVEFKSVGRSLSKPPTY